MPRVRLLHQQGKIQPRGAAADADDVHLGTLRPCADAALGCILGPCAYTMVLWQPYLPLSRWRDADAAPLRPGLRRSHTAPAPERLSTQGSSRSRILPEPTPARFRTSSTAPER